MNICFLTSEFPQPNRGGVQTVTYNLIRQLTARGCQVSVISLFPPENGFVAETPCLTFQGSPDFAAIERFASEQNIDIVINQSHHYVSSMICDFLKTKRDIKLIRVIHSDPEAVVKSVIDEEPLWTAPRWQRWAWSLSPLPMLKRIRRRSCLRKALLADLDRYDKIVFLSAAAMQRCYKLSGDNRHTKYAYIPNLVPRHDGPLPRGSAKEKLVIFVGRLNRESKRPDRLLKIWQRIEPRHRDWNLTVVGDGPLKKELMDFCRQKRLNNVTFAGQTDPTSFYKRASILCSTSTCEGFGLVFIEARDYGVVPMAFNSFSAVHDVIPDSNSGLLAKPFSLSDYAAKLSHLMDDAAHLHQLQSRLTSDPSYDRTTFCPDRIALQWMTLFQSIKQEG